MEDDVELLIEYERQQNDRWHRNRLMAIKEWLAKVERCRQSLLQEQQYLEQYFDRQADKQDPVAPVAPVARVPRQPQQQLPPEHLRTRVAPE
jgi:hypothetical protein